MAVIRKTSALVLDADGAPVRLVPKKVALEVGGDRADAFLWAIFEADGDPASNDDVLHFLPGPNEPGEAWKRRIMGNAGGCYFETRKAAMAYLRSHYEPKPDPLPVSLDAVTEADVLDALSAWHPEGHDPRANARALYAALVAVKEA